MIDTTSSRELDLRIIGKVILGYMCPGGRDLRVGEIAPIVLTEDKECTHQILEVYFSLDLCSYVYVRRPNQRIAKYSSL